jgi:integrase/recombinase XerD
VVRGFARHLQALDPATEVPPAGLLAGRNRRAVPYLYSDAEVAALMAATACLRPALHAATHKTLIGLLSASGLFSRGHRPLRKSGLAVRAAQRLME